MSKNNKLRRSSDGAFIGGVCAGLGKYLNLNPWIFRVLFILFTAIAGSGIIVYLALYMFVPVETSKLDSIISGNKMIMLAFIIIFIILGISGLINIIHTLLS